MNKAHSPQFIIEMKARLEQEKGQLEHEIDAMAQKPEYGRGDEDNASEVADAGNLTATVDATKGRLESINEALARVAKGTYGLTDDGELIPEARLRANPAATTLVK